MNLIVYGRKTKLQKAGMSVAKGCTTPGYAVEYQLLSCISFNQLLTILHRFAAFFLPELDGVQLG